jgi:hypothetical protein
VVIARLRLAALGVAALAGCTNVNSSSPHISASPAQLSASATRSQASSPSASPSVESLRLSFQNVPQASTTPLLDVKTDGRRVCWSAGPDASGHAAPDLYCLTPGTEPGLIFRNPNRDSNLPTIGVAGDHFAFVEQNERAFGAGGWRLWFIASPGQLAVEVDRSDPAGGMVTPPPTLAMDDGHLVWATFHQGASGPRSMLRVKDLATGAVTELEDSAFEQVQYWFPAIDGENVVFGTVEGDDWHIQLGRLGAAWQPHQLDRSGRAATPAISGDAIVWKHGGASVFDWGTLVRYSIADNDERPISLGAQAAINYPSIGDRYVAVWGRDDTKFYLYDVRADRVVRMRCMERAVPHGA